MADVLNRFLDMPLWLSIPCTVIYLGTVGWCIHTLYHYSDWRERRRRKRNLS